MRKEDLRLAAGLTTNMIANMGCGKHISMETLTKICETLNCDIVDVIELAGDGSENLQEQTKINDKELLQGNLDKLHSTELGIERIRKNLSLNIADVVGYCRDLIAAENCKIYRQGKNWYCEADNIKITVNSHSYSIITACFIK